MKLMMLDACLLLTISMMAQSPSTPTTTTVHSSGAFADLSTIANGSDTFVNVTRSDNSGTNATFLFFELFSFTNNSFTDTFGAGQIPDQSLKGDNTKHLSLSVDTSQLRSFQTTTCIFSFVTFTETCQPGPSALIQLDFQQDGSFSARTISDTVFTFFQFTEHVQSNSDSASAFANGSVLGVPVSNGFSRTGINRDTTITITSNH